MVDFWLVLAAGVSSILTAVTGFGHENRLTLVGIGNPAIRVMLIWVVAVAVQFLAWWAWTVLRNFYSK